ncbi:hypothetical protein A6E11_02590 [Aliivibrio fischeri]|nr:hypothetical protein A6E11_02590 [Aliivibrio fischeri]OEE26951.1 hypothetical protein A1Q3_04200 [Aliivibrio fischeri ZF-211]OCH06742.1 hypothetical protein A6E10_06545 [Aliivibrio fischeri]OCH10935.1 hypothetical protein A6E09_10870 [Aliivibrio fischeri]OCH19404.1 hypothetical protein A6E12_06235 [Aliivibrio fischeri]
MIKELIQIYSEVGILEKQTKSTIAKQNRPIFTHKSGARAIEITKLNIIKKKAFFFIDFLIVFFSCHSTIGGPKNG